MFSTGGLLCVIFYCVFEMGTLITIIFKFCVQKIQNCMLRLLII